MQINEIRSWLNRNSGTIYKVMAYLSLAIVFACTYVSLATLRG